MLQWISDRLWGYDFFISYAHADSPLDAQNRPTNHFVRALVAELRGHKYTVFHDETEYRPGEDLAVSTLRRVRGSSKLVLIARPVSMTVNQERHWVYDEVRTAIHASKEVIVVDINGAFADSSADNPIKQLIGSSRLRHNERLEDPDGAPSPILISRLVEGSRRVRLEVKRQRILMVVGIVLGMLAIASGILAYVADTARYAAVVNAERTRRSFFASALGGAEPWVDSDPTRAVAALDSVESCPRELREFTWHSLRYRADRLIFQTGFAKSDEGNPIQACFRPPSRGEPGRLFVVTRDGTVQDWTIDRNRSGTSSRRSLPVPAPKVVAFSRDATHLAFASPGPPATVTVQESMDGETACVIPLDRPASRLTFSRDGKTLWVWTDDHQLRAWSIPAGRELVDQRIANWPSAGENEFVTNDVVGIRPGMDDSSLIGCWIEYMDGERFAGYADRFSVAATQPLRIAGDRSLHEELRDCVEAEAGRFLLINRRIDSEFQTRYRLQGVSAQGAKIRLTDPVADYSTLDASPRCGVAAGTYQGSIRILDSQDYSTKSKLEFHRGSITDVHFANDDRHLVTIDDVTVCVWDVNGPDLPTLEMRPPDMQYSPDGSHLFFVGVIKMDDGDVDDYRAVWDRHSSQVVSISPFSREGATNQEVHRRFFRKALIKQRNLIHAVALSEQEAESLLEPASVSARGTVAYLKSPDDGNSNAELVIKKPDGTDSTRQSQKQGLTAMAWSPKEELLAVADGRGTIQLLRSNFKTVSTITIPDQSEIAPSAVKELCFSPDGAFLAILTTSDSTATVRLATIQNHSMKWTAVKEPATAICFSPDSSSLLFGDATGKVVIMNCRTQAVGASSLDHRSSVTRIQFSHDGRTLMTAARDDTNSEVFLRDPQTLQVFIPVEHHNVPARDAVFSPTKPELAFSTIDGKVVVWQVSPDDDVPMNR